MLARRVALHASRRNFFKHSQQWPIRHRQLSSASSSQAAAIQPTTTTATAALAGLTTELDKLAPRIDIRADQVTVIESPAEFYATLKHKIRQAKSRIYLATLYIGKTEVELVDTIRDALHANPDLRVSFLTDALRGTREAPDPSCASLLSSLVAEFPERVEVRMYHTPLLTGLRKKYIPKRINEGWGLQHMKLYGVDDEVILSGANLSEDYFTNRQDRYHLFSEKRVTDFFAHVHRTMCDASFRLRTDGQSADQPWALEWPADNPCPNPLDDAKGYVEATKAIFAPFITPHSRSLPPSAESRKHRQAATGSDTSLYPLLIIPSAHNNELPALKTILSPMRMPPGSRFLFTAGYFNPHPAVTTALLNGARALAAMAGEQAAVVGTVLTASPWANGFFGSAGVSGMLPGAYTLLARRFLRRVHREEAGDAVQLREWRHGTVGQSGGWTYHAKGLWITYGGQQSEKEGPSITVIGSSNYTTRSNSLDTEVGAVLVTSNSGLRKRLRQEEEHLLKHSTEVGESELSTPERKVGLKTRIAMLIVRLVGGSL